MNEYYTQSLQTAQNLPFETTVFPGHSPASGDLVISAKLPMLESLWSSSQGISFRARFQTTPVTPAHYFAITGLFSPKVIPACFSSYLVHQTWLHLTSGSVQKSNPFSRDEKSQEKLRGHQRPASQQSSPKVRCALAAWLARVLASPGASLHVCVLMCCFSKVDSYFRPVRS